MAYKDTIRFYRGDKAGLPTVLDGEPVWARDTGEFYMGGKYGNVRVGDGIRPEAYGAKGNGTHDDTAAINSAAAAATTAGQALVWKGGATYLITSALTIQCDCRDFGATINVDGAPTNAIVIGGPESGTTYASVYWGWRKGHHVEIPKLVNLDKPTSGWATGCGTGVLVRNAFENRLYFNHIYGFAIGLRFYAINSHGTSGETIGGGTCHNQVFLGHIEDCKVALQLDYGANGFTNENNFFGGRFNIQGGEGSEIADTRYIQIGLSTAFGCNNNIFYKPCLEGDGPEYHVEIYGNLNHIEYGRWEVTSVSPKIHFADSGASYSNGNVIFYGYGADFAITNDPLSYNNTIFNREGISIESAQTARSTLTLANAAGADYSSLRIVDSTLRPWGDHSADYSYDFTSRYLRAKQNGDTYPRLQIDANDGSISFGAGTAAPGLALSATEMAYLDGQDQAVKTTSSPVFKLVKTDHIVASDVADGNIPYHSEEDVITDGGLETWASATNLTNWTEYISGTSSVNQETGTPANIHGGSNACRIDVDSSNSEAYISQGFTLEVDALYKVTVWTKNSGTGKNASWIIYDDSYSVYLSPTTGLWQASPTGKAIDNSLAYAATEFYFMSHGSLTDFHIDVGNRYVDATSSSIFVDDISIVKVVGLVDSPLSTDGTDVDNTGAYKVAGVQVLGAQGAAVADADAGTIVAQFNTLLARLRTHGIIDT